MIMQDSIYTIMPKMSLRPNKVVLFSEVLRKKPMYDSVSNTILENTFELVRSVGKRSNVTKQFHDFKISQAAQKKLQEKINWLFALSKSRYVRTYSGKEIHNFKINFLTLTLPSTQKHSTSEITNQCFNQFLTEIRQRTKMENYVWRLEFQGNGNVHYHIVTDTYIDYFFARKIWNRILSKLGYTQEYTKKFSNMSFSEYKDLFKEKQNLDPNTIGKWYAKGKAEKWLNPNTIDVKSCSSNKSISFYISKYFGKQKDSTTKCNSLDNEENSFSLRLWFCSRSLSKLTSICDYCENCFIDWFNLIKNQPKAKEIFFDYARVVYFELKELSNYAKSLIYPLFTDYSKKLGYVPAGVNYTSDVG